MIKHVTEFAFTRTTMCRDISKFFEEILLNTHLTDMFQIKNKAETFYQKEKCK